MKPKLLLLISICILALLAGCVKRGQFHDLAQENIGLNKRTSSIMGVVIENADSISEANQEILLAALVQVEKFLKDHRQFTLKETLTDGDINAISVSFAETVAAYKVVFHQVINREYWKKLSDNDQELFARFHQNVLNAERKARDLHGDYRERVLFQESAKEALGGIVFIIDTASKIMSSGLL